uniref:ATP-binding protein n=1 Tax=uncultured Phenylobacterium sp. TaxID=349273 RepID=UPI0025FEFC9A
MKARAQFPSSNPPAARGPRGLLRTSFIRKVVGLSLVSTVGALILALAIFLSLAWRADEADLIYDQGEVGRHMANALVGPGGATEARSIYRSSEGMAWAAYYPTGGPPILFVPEDERVTLAAPLGVVTMQSAKHAHGADIHVPVVANGRRLGELVIRASNEEIRATLRRNALIAGGLSLLATLFAGVLSALLAVRTLAPLHALNLAIETVRRTRDFGAPVPVVSEDEIGRLTENFNALLADLEIYSDSLNDALIEVTAARDSAEDATRLKSEFVANMSHEIRTPLNGVLGMAQVLANSSMTAEQHEQLDVIRKSGASLLAVLNDVLDFSKIEAGRLEIEAEPFDIEEVAGGAYAVFTTAANSKGLSFGLRVAETAKGMWRGDSVRVRQLLYNLISNAIKFTDEGEVVVVIDRALEGERDELIMSVSDTGVGVAPENLPRLFEKFTQADSSTTRRYGGTGLGLTICRHISELMGGTIDARSEAGRGTTFVVRLPLEHLGASPPPPAAELELDGEPVDLGALRVLAAEDNVTNQLVLRTILHSLGVVPVVVADGRQAVDALAEANFDLVLMDIQMPVLDGVAATREIRAKEGSEGRRSRIV